jgi:hypothetical protein
MPGRLSASMGNVPQFEDFRYPVNQVAYDCQDLLCRPKDIELPVQDESEVRLHDLSVGLLQRSQSGVRRKVGNVPTISVPGLDQFQSFAVGCFREAHRVATANAARTVPSTTRQATHSSSRALVPLR